MNRSCRLVRAVPGHDRPRRRHRPSGAYIGDHERRTAAGHERGLDEGLPWVLRVVRVGLADHDEVGASGMPCQEAGQLLGPGGQGVALGGDRRGDTRHGLGNRPFRRGPGFRRQLMQELGRHVDANRTGYVGLGLQPRSVSRAPHDCASRTAASRRASAAWPCPTCTSKSAISIARSPFRLWCQPQSSPASRSSSAGPFTRAPVALIVPPAIGQPAGPKPRSAAEQHRQGGVMQHMPGRTQGGVLA